MIDAGVMFDNKRFFLLYVICINNIDKPLHHHIKDYQDPQWLWLLEIRKFLRYMLMPVLTEDQVKAMSETLEKTMNIRLKLTRVKNDSSAEDSKSSEKLEKAKPKHDPRVKWKEHYLGHFEDDIRQLGPLPLLNTDLFESKE